MPVKYKVMGKVLLAAGAALAFSVLPVGATVILGEFDWDPPDASDGTWTSDRGWVDLGYPGTGGNGGGFMSVTFPNTVSSPPDEWSEVIHTPGTSLFTGTWTTQMWLQMDFWQSNVVADAVQFRWKSTTNSSVWRYTVTPPTDTQTWGTVVAPLLNWNLWSYVGGSQGRYLSDLQSIEWIGVYIFRNTDIEQIYGIDNFRLMIPEPAEIAMLAAVIIGSGVSYRRRKKKKPGGQGGIP